MPDDLSYRGLPRTSQEWAALASIANGGTGVARDELRTLFMLGLVERQLGRVCLSRHGRKALGLPESPLSASGGRERSKRWTPVVNRAAD